MYYVYVLKLTGHAKHSYYIGFSSNLKRRFLEHKNKHEKVELTYYEAYQTEKLARTREKRLKYHKFRSLIYMRPLSFPPASHRASARRAEAGIYKDNYLYGFRIKCGMTKCETRKYYGSAWRGLKKRFKLA